MILKHRRLLMNRFKGRVPTLMLALTVGGCASLSPQGARVEFSEDASRVKNCQLLGKVKASPPYGLPTDWQKKLRNQAAELGANTVYAEAPGLQTHVLGDAYFCDRP